MSKKKPESEIGEVLEIVNFLKDNMMTRNEANERFFEINGNLVSIHQELKDIKYRLTKLEKEFEEKGVWDKEEVDAIWKRIVTIEKHLKMRTYK